MNSLKIVKELIEKDGLNQRNRKREIMYRKIYLQHKLREGGFTYKDIGEMFNQKHCSVVHNVKTHQDLMKFYRNEYKAQVKDYMLLLDNVKLELPKRNIFADIENASNLYQFRSIKKWIREKRYDITETKLE